MEEVTNHRRIARPSNVQELQSATACVNVDPSIALHSIQITEQTHPQPPPKRWQGSKGFGVRHINDDVPFSLWDDYNEKFRPASTPEMSYIQEKYQAERITFYEWILAIETHNPPKPIPLTVACMPTRFVPPGQGRVCLYGLAAYSSRRITYPCPGISWDRKESPTKSQMCAVVSAMADLANVRRINFLPAAIVVELVHGDGRAYSPKSLPSIVANRLTTYHYGADSFLSSMRNHTRERVLDPVQYLPGPMLQDTTNYIHEPNWDILSPGMRVSTEYAAYSKVYADAVPSTTSGILLRKDTTCYMTVANHTFLNSQEVFHPTPSGDKIGDIVDRYPERNIAMVQLTPANYPQCINQTYFQAQAPRRLAETTDMIPGSWFEVDGMSTGMLSFLYCAKSLEKPARPPGHPDIPVY